MTYRWLVKSTTKEGVLTLTIKDAEDSLNSGISLLEYLDQYYTEVQYTVMEHDLEVKYGLDSKGEMIKTFSGTIEGKDCLFDFSGLIASCKLYAKVHLWKDAIFELCADYPHSREIFLLVRYKFGLEDCWQKIMLVIDNTSDGE